MRNDARDVLEGLLPGKEQTRPTIRTDVSLLLGIDIEEFFKGHLRCEHGVRRVISWVKSGQCRCGTSHLEQGKWASFCFTFYY
jgi:hypothetical protein